MTSAPAHQLIGLVVIMARALALGLGSGLLAIGGTQIARTLRMGMHASNADAVILRSGILIGFGVAFLATGSLL